MPVSKRSSESVPYWQSECGRAVVYVGDCRDVMARMEPRQFHAVVTDPPYELAGGANVEHGGRSASKKYTGGVPNTGNWDSTGVAYDRRTWEAVLGVCKPGAHLLSFGGTRTFHRIACSIEDSGFEIRDTMMWLYGSGYPKGLDISKAIDNELGASDLREVVETRIAPDTTKVRAGFTGRAHSGNDSGSMREIQITASATEEAKQWSGWNTTLKPAWEPIIVGRKEVMGGVADNTLNHGCGGVNVDGCRVGELWPANVIRDDSADVESMLDGATRFFYSAKANEDDRSHSISTLHPTVKPLDLMKYLVRLVAHKGATVLDPFMGSGSTGCACIEEGVYFVGIEQSKEYADLAIDRLKEFLGTHEKVERLKTGKRVVKAEPPPQESW